MGSEKQRLLALLLLKNDRAFTEIAILDNRGMEVLKLAERRVYLPSELSDQRGSRKFKTAMEGKNYVSPVYFSDMAEPYVTMAVPLRVSPLEIIGVVVAEAYLKFLWENIAEVEFGGAGYAYLVDGQGNLIAHRDPSVVLKRINLSRVHKFQEFLRNPTAMDATPASEGQGISGEPVLGTYVPVPELGWAVILEEPVDIALVNVRRMEHYAVLLLGVGLLVGAAVIVWVSNRITGPIRELHRGAEVIGKGDLDHRVNIETGDEIEQLAQEFNKMARELKTSRATLEQRVEQRTRELSILYSLVATVNQSLDLNTVLKEASRRVLEVLPFDACRIYFLNHERGELQLKEHVGIGEEVSQTTIYKIGVGINGRVVESGEAFLFEDVQTDPRYTQLAYSGVAKRAGFHALASFPIKVKGKIEGTIDLLAVAPRRFTPEIIELISSVANQIGVAIDNARLFSEVKQKTVELEERTQQLSALYDVTATANRSLEIEPVLQEVIKKMTEIFHFDTMGVYLFNAQTDELQIRASFPGDRDDFQRVRVFRRGEGIVGKVAETGEAMIFEDVQSDAQYKKFSQSKNTQQTGYRFFAVFPIRAKLKPVGTIICNSKTARQLTADEIRLITSMLDQMGAAVENARLFEETVARAKELSTLYSLSTEIGQSLDLDFVLRRVMHKLLEIFGFDVGRIYVVGKNEKELRLMAQEGFPESISLPLSYKAGEGLMGRVFESGQPLFVEDIQTDREFQRAARSKVMLEAGYRGQFWIPVQAKGKTVGVVNCLSKKSYRFSGSEFQLLHSIVSRLGVAVENATLFSELREKSVELQKANVELQEANRIKEDFLAATSHELRTPLNVIIGNADLIRDGVFGEVNDRQKDALQKIFHYAENLLQLINNVLAATRAGAGKLSLNLSTFQVEEIVGNVQNYVEQLNRNGRLQFLWRVEPSSVSITTDALKLEEILMNLIGNAYKFTPRGKIEIRVRDLREKDRVEFSVADSGIGIAKAEVDRIFEQFYQLGDPHTGDHTGMGLGLNIVKQYLEMMRGDIQVESKLGVGSTFTFTLPYSIEDRIQ
jgi:signal transduction histidine kinase